MEGRPSPAVRPLDTSAGIWTPAGVPGCATDDLLDPLQALRPILEGADLDALLARARAGGHRYCLVQAWGHILQEIWTPDSRGGADFVTALMRWAAERDFAAAGGRTACWSTSPATVPDRP